MGNRPVELQADFCFINLVTGTFVKDQPNAPNMKILVLTEMSTRMVGCALSGQVRITHRPGSGTG